MLAFSEKLLKGTVMGQHYYYDNVNNELVDYCPNAPQLLGISAQH